MPFLPGLLIGIGEALTALTGVEAFTSIAVGISTALSGFGAALAFGSGLLAGIQAWVVVASFGALVFGLFNQPKSVGTQTNFTLDPQAPLPILFGRTGTGGNIVYRETYGKNSSTLAIQAVLSAGGPIEGFEGLTLSNYNVTLNNNPVTHGYVGISGLSAPGADLSGTKLFKGNFFMSVSLGPTPDTVTDKSFNGSNASGLPLFASTSLLSGLAHSMLFGVSSQTAFPDGFPTPLWIMKGVKCYDPREDSTYPGGSGSQRLDDNTTWTFSENPFICALAWLYGRWENASHWGGQGKKVWGIGALETEIDWPAFVAGANVADANGWKCGGVVTTGDDKFSVLTTILQAGSGLPVSRAGMISCMVNTPLTSVYTLTPDKIIGTATVTNTSAYRDRKNVLWATYREESQFFQYYSPPNPIIGSTYLDEDNGEIKSIKQQYSLVQDITQAYQLGAYDIANSREFLQLAVACKPELLTVRVGDCITTTLPELALSDQEFVCIGRSFDPGTLQVTLTLRSETTAKHAFALGLTGTAPDSPALDSYDPSVPAAPDGSAWTITADSIPSSDGLSQQAAIVVNGASDDPVASTVIAEYRVFGTTDWVSYSETPADQTTQIEITSVTSNTQYEVAISYRTLKGVVSDRLVLGPSTAGVTAVSWANVGGGFNAPSGAITNVPGALQPDSNGNLNANTIAFSNGSTYQTVTNAISNAVALSLVFDATLANAVANVAANVVTLSNTVTNAVTAINSNVSVLTGNVSTLFANVATLLTNATAQQTSITVLNANAAGANAAITALSTATTTNAAAQAATLSILTANALGANAAITALTTATSSNAAALAGQIVTINANAAGANATITANQAAAASNNAAQAATLSILTANAAGANAAISALTTATSSNAAALAASITTVQSNLNGTNAAVTANAVALSTLSGQAYGSYTLKASAGNAIASMELLAGTGPTSISTVQFQANNFQIYDGSGLKNLFSVSNTVVSMANVVISGSLLVANTVTASALNVANLSAISANLGTVTAGAITIGSTTKFAVDATGNVAIQSNSTGQRLTLSNQVLKVFDSSGTLRVQLGLF